MYEMCGMYTSRFRARKVGILMEQQENVVAARLSKVLRELVFVALQEGGFNFDRHEIRAALFGLVGPCWGSELEIFNVEHRGYALACKIAVPPKEDPENPKAALVHVSLSRTNGSPSLVFTWHSNSVGWRVCSFGTLALPKGHPLGELVHGETQLNMDAVRTCIDRTDKEVFQDLKQVGHIFEHAEL